MTSKKFSKAFTAVSLSTAFLISGASAAIADGHVYAGFPVTVKNYSGDKKTSLSYTGQIARHVLHDSLKKLGVKYFENLQLNKGIFYDVKSTFGNSTKSLSL